MVVLLGIPNMYTKSLMQLSKQPNMWQQHSVCSPADTGQGLQFMFKSNIRRRDKCNLQDFDQGIVVGVRWAG